MIIIGDAKTELQKLPDQSVNCCVTSPPYFGLRDYGHPGQIGLEETPEQFIKILLEVFREVSRVLRDDGTLWLNLGDSYAGNGGGDKLTGIYKTNKGSAGNKYRTPGKLGLKKKDLIGIPWKVAFALQEDGWYLRNDIIWHKPNVMPESAKDRCTVAHEYIFLLSKKPFYYFDYEAIKEPAIKGLCGSKFNTGQTAIHQPKSSDKERNEDGKRLKRTVWTISNKPYKGAHFATFPPDLIEPCILAGCPQGGIVLDPFFGSGTVGQVAKQNDRDFIGIELNPEYKPLIDRRLDAAHYQSSF